MRAGIVIQARYSSRRLPGKVLRPLLGKPLLGWLVERMQTVSEAQLVIVATSKGAEDDAVASFARDIGVQVHRGLLDDVLGRFVGTCDAFALDVAVRVSGDSPLLDPALVSQALQIFGEGGSDLVTNVRERTYPKGQSVEAVSAGALRKALAEARGSEEREHVTPYFYAHPDRFRIRNFRFTTPAAEVRLSVDTAEDFAMIERIARCMTRPHREYGVAELIALYGSVSKNI
jgi:spore coat polysaccharide biosynthesis protein SpsF